MAGEKDNFSLPPGNGTLGFLGKQRALQRRQLGALNYYQESDPERRSKLSR